MRLSTDPTDPGFHPYAKSGLFVAVLEGQVVADAVTADEERGFVSIITETLTFAGVKLRDERKSGKVEIKVISGLTQGAHAVASEALRTIRNAQPNAR